MHAAAISPRGGVAPKTIRLRGQSIIEYVLIIALIGLVIVFAGPGVAGAIRNQFNQVTNTVDSGTDGDNFMSAEEKAYQEAMKTVASKEAKDWSLDEQKAAATDIAKNGTSSVVYAKAKAAMDAWTTWSVKLTNGKVVTYRIIGINHDDLGDGSGKAGLTLQTVQDVKRGDYSVVPTSGPWESSPLREQLNGGDIMQLFPEEFQQKLVTVTKWTNNVNGKNKNASVTATSDKMFLLSYCEIHGAPSSGSSLENYSWVKSEGFKYDKPGSGMLRSLDNDWAGGAFTHNQENKLECANYSVNNSVCPAWCF